MNAVCDCENLSKILPNARKYTTYRHIRAYRRRTWPTSYSFPLPCFHVLLRSVHSNTCIRTYLFIYHENNQITASSERTTTVWRTCVCVVAIYCCFAATNISLIAWAPLMRLHSRLCLTICDGFCPPHSARKHTNTHADLSITARCV